MNIIYQDEFIIIINKSPGIPVQADKTKDASLMEQIQAELRQPVYLVHRLDRPVSGLIVFALNVLVANDLNQKFKEGKIKKVYHAVVGNRPEKDADTLTHYLRKDAKQNRSFAFNKNLHHTQKAELKYRLIGSIERYHLLEIELLTGRHHQIRAQLAAINCPVKGDVKYGFRRGNRDRSIHLHAVELAFAHPHTQELMTFNAPPPEDNVWKAFGDERDER